MTMNGPNSQTLPVEEIREDFPILNRTVNGEPLVYFDNGASSQTPEQVVDVISQYYRQYNSNVHRGLHQLSQEASLAYEQAHDRVAEFIGADGREEIIFTKNTTEALNSVAYGWGLANLQEGDEVVLTEMEHHASLVTWQQVARKVGANLKFIRVTEDGYLDMDHAQDLITDTTAMVCAVHASNTLGTLNPVSDIADMAHDHNALLFVDGAQSTPGMPVDVQGIKADFFAFSGHKMCGPTGIGVLYGKQHLLEAMSPHLYGGMMIEKVTFEDATWHELPWKFEAGTPVIAQGIALAEAIDYLSDIGMERVQAHEEALAEYAYDRLSALGDVEIYGPPGDDRIGLVSFNMADVHAHDVAEILNQHGIAIRAGDHCTQPLHDKLDVTATARASFYIYNTTSEVDRLIQALTEAREIFT